MTIGVLAVQGAFIEHEAMLRRIGADCFEIRQKKDLSRHMDGLILPGGESTVMRKLIFSLDIYDGLMKLIKGGLPVFGTCAGLILLADNISNDNGKCFGTLPVTVKRNAYGRQLGSFNANACFQHVGTFPMTFIRAPYVESCQEAVEIMASCEGKIVGVKYGNQLGVAFHPELTDDTRIHEYFLSLCSRE